MNILELIDDIYEAGADPSYWLTAMKKLSDAAGGVDAVMGGLTAGRLPLFMAPRTDPDMVRLYAEHYHLRNPMQLAMQTLPMGRAAAEDELVDIETFHRGEFYNDWCLPQGHLSGAGINLPTAGGWRAILMISSRQMVETETLRGLERLAPHLTRAFRINQILDENRSASLSAFAALEQADRGVFLVSTDGICEPSNALAEQILARTDGLFLRQGRLDCALPAETRLLHQALSQCAQGRTGVAGNTVEVTRRNGRMPLQVLAVPLPSSAWSYDRRGHQVMLLVTDPELRLQRKVEQLRHGFKLTPAEAAVLYELACGGDRDDIARRLGISLATVRTQLTSIFDKTGVRRQADIVRLLMEHA